MTSKIYDNPPANKKKSIAYKKRKTWTERNATSDFKEKKPSRLPANYR